jgi:hypothetical protein
MKGSKEIMKTETILIEIISISLIILWSYAAFSKFANLDKSHSEMLNQVFPAWMADILYWLIPTIEVGLCVLLVFTKTKLVGLYGSLILMSSFTLYIAIVMTGVFGRVPCSCGGILKNMSYSIHLFFNLFFVVLALLGIGLVKRWTTFNTIKLFKRKEIARHGE